MRILKFGLAVAVALAACGSSQAGIINVQKTVLSTAGPWDIAVNPAFTYGIGDNTAATVYSAANGFDFLADDALTITYVSGLTSAFTGVPPSVDGAGYVGSPFKNDVLGSSGQPFPSFYMGPFPVDGSRDVFLNALVGTFTDSSGMIIGSPFAINNGPLTVMIPVGATQLQLGINDDIFADNTGSLLVNVSGPGTAVAVPEPATMTLLGMGLAGMFGVGYRRRKVAV